jgi:hypothetical protein
MGPSSALTAGVAVAVVLSGCGSGGDKASTTTASPSAGGMRSRLLTSNELAGFHVVDTLVRTTPDSWIAVEQLPADAAASEKAMLKRDGFRGGVHEDLTSGSRDGASIVVQLRSPQAAADAVRFYLERSKTFGPYATFKVTGIPNAVGYSIGGVDQGGMNIVFTDGPYYHLVGQERGGKAGVAKLNAAARHLYQRVRG